MDVVTVVVLLTLFALASQCDSSKDTVRNRFKQNAVYCKPKSLVKYVLTVNTYWSKQTFPKMYPMYRPHAQWSPLVGRSHDLEHHMWVVGENATLGVKLFAEQGIYHALDTEFVQGYNGVLDSFVAPAIDSGVGQTSCVIVLDGQHSKLSFMMKIIPSPDWFIGVSNLDLCARGRWKTSLRMDLHPYDAGTDQGLTFSSPNWPSVPAEPISKVTSSFPNHAASSFLYPDYKALPRLAAVSLDLVTEYRQRKTFAKVHKNTTTMASKNSGMHKYPKIRDDETFLSSNTTDKRIGKHRYPGSEAKSDKSRSSKLDSSKTIKDIFADDEKTHVGRESTVTENSSVDCHVGQWAEWNPCSRSCGLGQRERSRNISIYPRNRGANCPLLREQDVCGSMRNCQIARFTFLEDKKAKKRMRPEKSNLGRDQT
ncbi:unnamed protein product [Candidula unifasciata]|uniref:Spondin domain-containing protein n=1 Tax=Candidula unifasciata TaxID=100452 RepID=A0A8S3ZL82_9EUPU|nr:unnamed protein product [Candidula unifasciata]